MAQFRYAKTYVTYSVLVRGTASVSCTRGSSQRKSWERWKALKPSPHSTLGSRGREVLSAHGGKYLSGCGAPEFCAPTLFAVHERLPERYVPLPRLTF